MIYIWNSYLCSSGYILGGVCLGDGMQRKLFTTPLQDTLWKSWDMRRRPNNKNNKRNAFSVYKSWNKVRRPTCKDYVSWVGKTSFNAVSVGSKSRFGSLRDCQYLMFMVRWWRIVDMTYILVRRMEHMIFSSHETWMEPYACQALRGYE